MNRVPKSAPTLNRMGNGLNELEDENVELEFRREFGHYLRPHPTQMRMWLNFMTDLRRIEALHGVTP